VVDYSRADGIGFDHRRPTTAPLFRGSAAIDTGASSSRRQSSSSPTAALLYLHRRQQLQRRPNSALRFFDQMPARAQQRSLITKDPGGAAGRVGTVLAGQGLPPSPVASSQRKGETETQFTGDSQTWDSDPTHLLMMTG
jgi:hypothetical protein